MKKEDKNLECEDCCYCKQFKDTEYGRCEFRDLTWIDLHLKACVYFKPKED